MLPADLRTLVNNFHDQIESYKSPAYNETQLRRDFLDKFIKILGWDVDNEKAYAESFREVIHEDRIRIAGQSKAPDYCIQSNGGRLFYIEAKKPSVNIHDDPSPAFQVRRYGWTAKMPVCLLTDFHEFSVYDTSIKPKNTDDAAIARIFYCRYDELDAHNPKYPDIPTNWDFLYGLFSKEAVYKGSLEKFRTSGKKKGTQEVDDAFLEEIEHWREHLTANISLRNELTERQLNYVIQKTIDRLIFLRICEDRGIENANVLKTIADGKDIYKHLLNVFISADEKFNSGLFHFHSEKDINEPPDTISESLFIDDKVLKEIIGSLYYPAPYEFAVLPADILGSIYERFLGKVIRMTSAHRAKVEEKPEVRKAGGVYYTPRYIVNYIVENTIGVQLQNKTPKTLKNFRIVDPACGSGSFLINAYQYLLDWYLREYMKSPEQYKRQCVKTGERGGNGVYKLTIGERKRILTCHIFGVDIDAQAVEVTKLSLLLKALEGLNEQEIQKELFNERVLPDLSRNIKCGNSLIGTDFYMQGTLGLSEDEQYKINAFDWETEFADVFKDGGFDAVIGNPPYVQVLHSDNEYIMNYFQSHYVSTSAFKKNLFPLFVEKGINLLKPDSKMGMIIPDRFFFTPSYIYTRKKIITETTLNEIVEILAGAFSEATVGNAIFILSRPCKNNYDVIIKNYTKKDLTVTNKVNVNNINQDNNYEVNLIITETSENILRKCKSSSVLLKDVADCHVGIMVKNKDEKFTSIYKKGYLPIVKGKQISRYCIIEKSYFEINKVVVFGGTKNPEKHLTKPKLLLRKTGSVIHTAVDTDGIFAEQSVYLILPVKSINPFYLCAVLNSKLMGYLFRNCFITNPVAYPYIQHYDLEKLPIPFLDLSKKSDKAQHDKLVALVDQMLDLKKKEQAETVPQTKTMLGRQIQAVDKQIDTLVYELYGLTEDEIKVVEGER
ncbi:MAG: N-6 DNA methylase [Treponema sp.]|jgi:type I restriction-modification system DNA methylase subunit|nr:N-6 DNA methylase [Treponema sp.]